MCMHRCSSDYLNVLSVSLLSVLLFKSFIGTLLIVSEIKSENKILLKHHIKISYEKQTATLLLSLKLALLNHLLHILYSFIFVTSNSISTSKTKH